MQIVTWTHPKTGLTYFLRGTVWAFERDRATVYATEIEARAALDTAKKFMKASVYKSAKIVGAE